MPKNHVHRQSCLEANAWGRTKCPGIGYVEWIKLAGEIPDQGNTWREHERIARRYYAEDRELQPWYYDLGGEA